MRMGTIKKAVYGLLAGGFLFANVNCLPSGAQLRGLVQNGILSLISGSAELVVTQIFPALGEQIDDNSNTDGTTNQTP